MPGEESRARRPDRPDPFDLFRTFLTAALGPATRVRLRPDSTAEEAVARKGLASTSYAADVLPGDAVVARLLAAVAAAPDGVTLGDLRDACPPIPLGGVIRTLAFLAKMGIVDVL